MTKDVFITLIKEKLEEVDTSDNNTEWMSKEIFSSWVSKNKDKIGNI